MRKWKYLAAGLVFLLFGLALPKQAQAQAVQAPERSLTITPLQLEYKLDPGDSRQGTMTVKNKGAQNLKLHFYSQVFSVKGEDYGDYEFVGADPGNAGGWVAFAPPDVELAPGTDLEVEFTILPPQQAAPGGHYAILFAEAEPAGGNAVGIGQRAGALVFMQVGGQLQKFGQISSFKTRWWQPAQPLRAELRLHNEGNTHFRAVGEVTFKNIFGISQYKASISGLVLPQTIRRFELSTNPSSLLPGIYIAAGKVDIFEQTVKLPPRLVVVLPPFYAIVFTLLLAAAAWWFIKRRQAQLKLPRPRRVYN